MGADQHPTPWLAWSVGERVVVRYRLAAARDRAGPAESEQEAGGPDTGPRYTDALGVLTEVGPAGVVVRTRRGDVAIPGEAIAVGKRVPPPPPRRPRAGPTHDGAGTNEARPDDDSSPG